MTRSLALRLCELMVAERRLRLAASFEFGFAMSMAIYGLCAAAKGDWEVAAGNALVAVGLATFAHFLRTKARQRLQLAQRWVDRSPSLIFLTAVLHGADRGRRAAEGSALSGYCGVFWIEINEHKGGVEIEVQSPVKDFAVAASLDVDAGGNAVAVTDDWGEE